MATLLREVGSVLNIIFKAEQWDGVSYNGIRIDKYNKACITIDIGGSQWIKDET